MEDLLFQFHATAAAASGTITLPFKEQIVVQASSSLPPGGGYGSARVKDFRFKEILSFREAYTYVSGSYSRSENSVQTATTAVITGLNILDVVTADKVVSRLTSERRRDSDEVRIIPLGSKFENLMIAGRRLRAAEMLQTTLFSEVDSFAEMQGAYANEQQAKARYEHRTRFEEHVRDVTMTGREDEIPKRLLKYFPQAARLKQQKEPEAAVPADTEKSRKQDTLSCSLVPNLHGRVPGHDAAGHAVYVRGFGAIRLAEWQASYSRRRLTMLSIDLGCPFEGRLSVCYAESNGSIWG